MALKARCFDSLLAGLVDSSGNRLDSGYIKFYDIGTSTAKVVYEDRDKTVSAGSTITLDTTGGLLYDTPIFLDGLYKIEIYNSNDSLLLTLDGVGQGISEDAWIDASTYASLNAAITAIGATETDLMITSQISMTANATVPATMKLIFTRSGSINQSTYIPTINGTIDAGRYQIFDGTADIRFGAGSTDFVYPEWFGFSTSATSAANKTALELAINSLIESATDKNTAGKIKFAVGAYAIDTGIVLTADTQNLTFEGASGFQLNLTDSYPDGTFLQFQGSGTGIDTTGTSVFSIGFRDMRIGHKSGTGTQPDYILKIGSDIKFENCMITGAGTSCVQVASAANISMYNTQIGYTSGFGSVGNGLEFKTAVTNTTFSAFGCKFRQANIGCIINNLQGSAFYGCTFESNDAEGLKITRGTGQRTENILFSNCWFENNYNGGSGAPAGYQVVVTGDAAVGNSKNIKFDTCWFTSGDYNNVADLQLAYTTLTKLIGCSFASVGVGFNTISITANAENTFIDMCRHLDTTNLDLSNSGIKTVIRRFNEGDDHISFEPPINTTSTTITNAQIKALVGTPIELVAAPGAGELIEFVNATLFLDYGGGALAEPSAPDDLAIEYDNGTGTQIVTWDTTGFITATADAMEIVRGTGVGGGASAIGAATNVNKNIALVNTGTDYTGAASTSTMTVKTSYRIHKTGL